MFVAGINSRASSQRDSYDAALGLTLLPDADRVDTLGPMTVSSCKCERRKGLAAARGAWQPTSLVGNYDGAASGKTLNRFALRKPTYTLAHVLSPYPFAKSRFSSAFKNRSSFSTRSIGASYSRRGHEPRFTTLSMPRSS